MTSTSEYYRETATRLAAGLGLSEQDADAIARCRDKGRLREALDRAGVRQPVFRVISEAAEAPEAARAVGLPCVVKPVDESGSARVRRCGTAAEAAGQTAVIVAVRQNGRGQAAAGRALVESCLDGPEFSVETWSAGGRHRVLGIVRKTVTGAPHFVESRHVFPADVDDDVARELAGCALAAVGAAGLREGPAHTEVMLTADGPAVVEVNPRLAGGLIPELIRLVSGADLVVADVVAAAGGTPELPETFSGHAGIQFVLPPVAGILDRVTGTGDAAGVDGVERVAITAEPGSPVGPPVDAYGRIGHVIATGPSAAAVTEALDKAIALITVEVVTPPA